MARIISLKIFTALTANPNGKLLPRDKTLGIDKAIHFYDIEEGNNNGEGEESEIFFIHDSSISEFKQNLGKRYLIYIDTFDPEGPAIIRIMYDQTVKVFRHL